jgi:hypothetical protein
MEMKMKMKQALYGISALALVSALSACGGREEPANNGVANADRNGMNEMNEMDGMNDMNNMAGHDMNNMAAHDMNSM